MALTDQIDALAQSCKTLIGPHPDPVRMAHAGLHPRNAHPAVRATYQDALEPVPLRRWITKRAKALSRRVALPALALHRREGMWFGNPLPEQADLLIVSHMTNASQLVAAQDSYFGDLPHNLSARNIRPVTACLNHTWLRARDIPASTPSQAAPRVILSRCLSASDEWRFARELRDDISRLSQTSAADTQTQALLGNLRCATPDSASLTALRTAQQIGALASRLRPRAVLFTFEGHPWERLAMQAARTAAPDILCLAYHHTVLFPRQMALASSYGHNFDPDVIFTTGTITADWFAQQPAWAHTPVHALGSARAPDHVAVAPRQVSPTRLRCLVIPEGLPSETVFLANRAREAAQNAPEIQFCLRLHPVLSRTQILDLAPELSQLPPNMYWSEAALQDDLDQASHVLYRGSTLAITAVLQGLQPLYAPMPDEPFSIDPLATLTRWRMSVFDAADLVQHMRTDAAIPNSSRHLAYTAAADYCRTYFQPFDTDAVISCIETHRGTA